MKQAILVDDAKFVDVGVEKDVQSEWTPRTAGAARPDEESSVDSTCDHEKTLLKHIISNLT